MTIDLLKVSTRTRTTLRHHVIGGPEPKPRKKRRRREEHREQEKFVAWARLRGLLLCHPANELVGQVSKGRAAELKRLGVSAGVPDILIFDRRADVAIEFKGPRGSPSKYQRVWLELLEKRGWSVAVVRTSEEAKAFIVEVGL
jgi:hypothetical protein